ncbi:hypothetical protein D3C83_124120 [compost metagenome]
MRVKRGLDGLAEKKVQHFLPVAKPQEFRLHATSPEVVFDQKGVPVVIVGDENGVNLVHNARIAY